MNTLRSRRFRPGLDSLPQRLAPAAIVFPSSPPCELDTEIPYMAPPPVTLPVVNLDVPVLIPPRT